MVSSSKKKSSKKKNSLFSSKTKKIKKSLRNASKKIGRRHDSSSEDSISLQAVTVQSSDSNSDNDSTSSLPMSSSSSEGTHRSRKKGSRLKKRDKSRASRRSSSKEDLIRGKKRKRSKKKKKGHHESRKKSHKKKPRTRRHASVSPDNDDSSSSSTCKSSSTSEENGIQRHRVKLKENKKRRVESKIETILDKERTDKSPKGSSNSRSSDMSNRDSQVRENFVGENNSRRLKSVITVVVKPDEEEEKAVGNFGGIPHSVDASDTRSKRDPSPLSSPASDRKRRTEDFYGGRSSLITQRLSEPLEYRKTDFSQNNIQYPLQEEHRNESEKDYSGPILPDDSPGGNDLESVLRRKALENLKKFRGKVETDVKTIGNESKTDDDNVDQLSTGKDVVVRRRSPELGSSNVQKNTYEVNKDGVNTNKLSTAKGKFSWRRLPQQVSSKVTDSAMLNESMKPPLKRDDPRSSMSVQQIPDKRTEAVKVNAVDPLDRSVLSENPIKEHGSSQAFDAKSESDSLLHKEKHSGMQKTAGVSSDKETIVNKVNEAHTKDETNRATSPISTDDDHRRKIKDVSAPNSATGHLSNDQKNEAKEGSDFKEKKMTVMRGGEMVEVSYKVYIPQRAAALARRQLKR